MIVGALVETLRARGVTLEPRGDRLRVSPASAVTPDEVDALRRYKPEVLRLLMAPGSSSRPAGGDHPLASRVAVFQRQLEAWTATGAPGVPLLTLPGVEILPGLCVGCGVALAAGRTWRCFMCVEAVRVVLRLPPEGAET